MTADKTKVTSKENTTVSKYANKSSEEMKALYAEIKEAYEEKKKQDAEAVIKSLIEQVEEYAEYFGVSEKRKVARALRLEVRKQGTTTATPDASSSSNATPDADKKTYKYELATGEKWTGKGRPPKAFTAWKEANKDKEFPAYPYSQKREEAIENATKELADIE
ncbi:MAG: hypothetical protein FH747_04635 [Stenotrophomonas sp.]|uniref:H-NS family nucleoid-associated regulatory protein n=1 Tax=Stenotrophomonas sp. TaxID=69392 RepID=UPI0013540FB5|nr:H-NS family nucleoid-associated regulatory protein [Stenotrophomonas sp.]MTI72932.1 hypothetical protein [Stenotrophomonas sp.]